MVPPENIKKRKKRKLRASHCEEELRVTNNQRMRQIVVAGEGKLGAPYTTDSAPIGEKDDPKPSDARACALLRLTTPARTI